MRIFVTGASGLIGSRLCPELAAAGHEVVALSRRKVPDRSDAGVRWVLGDPRQVGSWTEELLAARAYDRGHLYSLRDAGADHVVMETYHSALAVGTQALRDLNVDPLRAEKIQATFHQAETEAHEVLYSHWQEKSEGERFGASYQELFLELEEILSGSLSGDRDDSHDRSARGWTPPPKGYADHLE